MWITLHRIFSSPSLFQRAGRGRQQIFEAIKSAKT
jgi:hypothetical protein